MEEHMTTSVRITLATAAAALALVTACSSNKSSTPPAGTGGSQTPGGSTSAQISSTGGTLVGPNGHTLYENTVDTTTNIMCTGSCSSEWPPLTGDPVVAAPLNAADFATATRPDGSRQVTFQGHPLYYFDEDKSAGEHKGNGIADGGGSWHVAGSAPLSTTGGTSSVPPTMSSSSAGSGGGGY
jgi:predicted lipoprotein with Yx(FWY)xxD motif